MAMSRAFRATVSSDARMVCEDGTEVPCRIVNISAQGAKIQFNPRTFLPEEFRLASDDLALHADAWVIWRIGSTAGVRFLDPITIGLF